MYESLDDDLSEHGDPVIDVSERPVRSNRNQHPRCLDNFETYFASYVKVMTRMICWIAFVPIQVGA